MRPFNRLGFAAALSLVFPLLPGGTCSFDFNPPGGGGGGGGGGSNTIRIRLVNATNTTLDPDFYISGQPVSVSELFNAANKYSAFGVGTLGLLGPSGSDQFDIACNEIRVFGTQGGRFGDNLNAPDGVGRQLVLTQDLNVFCGDTVTFTFSRSGSGFTTRFDVQP